MTCSYHVGTKSVVQIDVSGAKKKKKSQKHTTARIPRWSPTRVLMRRYHACIWLSGREA